MNLYLLKDGKLTTTKNLSEWEKWCDEINNRIIARTILEEDTIVEVCTVFLALDQNLRSRGKPILFETMVFGGEVDGHTERYSTLNCTGSA